MKRVGHPFRFQAAPCREDSGVLDNVLEAEVERGSGGKGGREEGKGGREERDARQFRPLRSLARVKGDGLDRGSRGVIGVCVPFYMTAGVAGRVRENSYIIGCDWVPRETARVGTNRGISMCHPPFWVGRALWKMSRRKHGLRDSVLWWRSQSPFESAWVDCIPPWRASNSFEWPLPRCRQVVWRTATYCR